jgi:hypothetical protein
MEGFRPGFQEGYNGLVVLGEEVERKDEDVDEEGYGYTQEDGFGGWGRTFYWGEGAEEGRGAGACCDEET